MFRLLRTGAPFVVAAALVAGCASAPPTQRLPEMTFAHLDTFQINVAKVVLDSRFKAPLTAPRIEHQVPAAPAKALEQWLTDRFRAVGSAGTLRMVIDDASVTETALARDDSLKGTFTKQQTRRYDMAVKATLELVDAGGITLGWASAGAARSVTGREDLSPNDREKLLYDTAGQLMADFNAAMDANVKRYLSNWIR